MGIYRFLGANGLRFRGLEGKKKQNKTGGLESRGSGAILANFITDHPRIGTLCPLNGVAQTRPETEDVHELSSIYAHYQD